MKISTKGRYSVTALYELALRYGEGAVSLKSIATSQGLSENYLEQLMAPLRRAGIVKSVRGAQGGYMLARDPKDITIGEIITTVEGPIALVDCLLTSAESSEKVCDSISNVLNHITLYDLCVDQPDNPKKVGCAR